MSEKTLVLIKPDAVERHLIGTILNEYERNKLKIAEMKMLIVSKELAEEQYEEHKEKSFYDDLISYITRGPLVALVIEGENAIERVRTINGATDPEEAESNTIRALYGQNVTENSVHASDSPETAEREISIWFG